MNSWKNFFVNAIQDFNKRYKSSHFSEINIITITNKRHKTYEFSIKHNMHAVEWRSNMNIAKNAQLINSLDRSINHPLIKKFNNVPFKD